MARWRTTAHGDTERTEMNQKMRRGEKQKKNKKKNVLSFRFIKSVLPALSSPPKCVLCVLELLRSSQRAVAIAVISFTADWWNIIHTRREEIEKSTWNIRHDWDEQSEHYFWISSYVWKLWFNRQLCLAIRRFRRILSSFFFFLRRIETRKKSRIIHSAMAIKKNFIDSKVIANFRRGQIRNGTRVTSECASKPQNSKTKQKTKEERKKRVNGTISHFFLFHLLLLLLNSLPFAETSQFALLCKFPRSMCRTWHVLC